MNGSIRPFLGETSAEHDPPDSLFIEAMHPLTAALPPKRSEAKQTGERACASLDDPPRDRTRRTKS